MFLNRSVNLAATKYPPPLASKLKSRRLMETTFLKRMYAKLAFPPLLALSYCFLFTAIAERPWGRHRQGKWMYHIIVTFFALGSVLPQVFRMWRWLLKTHCFKTYTLKRPSKYLFILSFFVSPYTYSLIKATNKKWLDTKHIKVFLLLSQNIYLHGCVAQMKWNVFFLLLSTW